MTPVKISPIVTGHGEIQALPLLIRRIALEVNSGYVPMVLKPQRISESTLILNYELEKAVENAANRLAGSGGIVILLDCDTKDWCPAQKGPEFLKRAQQTRKDIPVSVILAKMEFESWFLASAESLRNKRNLNSDFVCPPNSEELRGAKEYLEKYLAPGKAYSPTIDQPALAQVFDLQLARSRSNSFDKCYRDIFNMLKQLREHTQ
ncbi:hypothetical protein AUK40_02665 [Candidatus Wirthbacteria bacterium CG2_30_54_11]|uniref:DUF4276 family protein n=1 Tax=Candidatus Wirthbacteria bacterium CG2_30_54_11 TaxID=1817892 RepID=A0A1J5IX59_9BACT|nr:MAG: hypothetical protein AUK40_02665 [Candidatus Wirthbacteria bacterium CG2_30_54_11]